MLFNVAFPCSRINYLHTGDLGRSLRACTPDLLSRFKTPLGPEIRGCTTLSGTIIGEGSGGMLANPFVYLLGYSRQESVMLNCMSPGAQAACSINAFLVSFFFLNKEQSNVPVCGPAQPVACMKRPSQDLPVLHQGQWARLKRHKPAPVMAFVS